MSQVEDKTRFLRKAFGALERSRDGKNIAVACPQCKDSTKKKLAIRLDDDRVNCWVCHLHGRVISVLRRFKPSLVHEYIEKFGYGNIDIFIDEDEKHVEMPENFRLLAPRKNDRMLQWAWKYARKRGITEHDMWRFKMGVSTERRFYRRIIMLSFDASGKLNYYAARAVDEGTFRKYWNAEMPKKSIIFNEINIDWSKELTIVEGPLDLIRCDDNATCLLGSSLSEDSLLFGRIYQNKTPIVLALDKDMEQKEWQRTARMLDSYDIPVRIMDLGEFGDVGEMTNNAFLAAKKTAVKWDRTEALLRKIKTIGTGSLFGK